MASGGWSPNDRRGAGLSDLTRELPGVGPLPQSVRIPAGDLATRMQHPSVTRVQQMYRTLVNESVLSSGLGPNRPFQTQMGSYTVPSGLTYFIFGQEVRLFGQDGVSPGTSRPLDGQMTDIMGYTLNLNGNVQESTLWQLDPVDSQVTRQAFDPKPFVATKTGPTALEGRLFTRNVAAQFNRASAGSFASTSGQGMSLRPFLSNAEAQGTGPWTVVAQSGTQVSMDLVVFRRVMMPVTFWQAQHWGYVMPSNMASYLLKTISPSASV